MDGEAFKDADAASYDAQVAAIYDRHIARLASLLASEMVTIAGVKEGDHVLDVGCGTGVGTRAIAERVGDRGRALGVDLSASMLNEARRTSPAMASFEQMDAEMLELEPASFDVVTSLCAILHFPNVDGALREMRRVLKPGGTLVVAYGAGRPPLGLGLARHALALRRSRGSAPSLAAPEAILSAILSVTRELPRLPDPVLTTWAGRSPLRSLRRAVDRAGFHNLTTSWAGSDHAFDSGFEFWEAQAAIVTEARRALQQADPEAALSLRKQTINEWQRRKDAGVVLSYPYGAVFVRAERLQ